MGTKTPPFEPYPAWTQAKFFGFLRSGLREKFNRWPPKYEVIKEAAKAEQLLDEDGEPVRFKTGKKAGQLKTVKTYLCVQCGERFRQKEVQVDHKTPAGTLKSFNDLGSFAQNLFVGTDKLQVMCKPCHLVKTNKEKKQ